jgi:hypothetical protein
MSDLFNSSPRAIPSLHLNLKVAVAIFYFQTNAVRKVTGYRFQNLMDVKAL